MNSKVFRTLFSIGLVVSIISSVLAGVTIGQKAPEFSLPASDGKTYKLSDYPGKFIVLEWYNTDCPFIRKHYESGNMQALQERYMKKGVIWFSIASSAPGKEGYLPQEEAEKDRQVRGSKSTATLLDPDGKVGHLYGAKSTPHMFIIDPKGILIYQGAIDDKPSADKEDVPGAKNYVAQALDEVMAGKPVSTPQTRPYGCFVQYK